MSSPSSHHRVLIVGGGTAGIGLAASLLRRDRTLDIAVIDPADTHCYQPALTLVGGGCYPVAKTRRAEAAVMPAGVTWLKAGANAFDAERRVVELSDGRSVGYDYLVLCPGLQLDWEKIEGLPETLGRNGVTSNYDRKHAAYTWELLQAFKGGRAIFTQPPMPIKCPGAPQKIAYLAADYWRKQKLQSKADIQFSLAGDKIFSVDAFVRPLLDVVKRYGIRLNYRRNLIAVDGERRLATFRVTDADGSVSEETESFDLLHVVPSQSAPDFIKRSPFANADGWVAVDPHTLQHPDHAGVFALGDVAGTPNSKTAAAARSQIPVVRDNLLARMKNERLNGAYTGYGACPLTTARGRVILAEFRYKGVLAPTFPIDQTRERRSMWHFKKSFLPWFYWNYLLKGRG